MKLDSSIVNKKLETTSRRHCPRVNSIKRVDRHHSLGSVPVAPTKPPSNPIHEQSPIFGNQEKIRCVGNYDIGRTIGKGKFGTVKIATHVLTGDVVWFCAIFHFLNFYCFFYIYILIFLF